MTQISASQARQELPSLLNRVFAGEEFEIVKNKIPFANLVPVKKKMEVLKKRRILPEAFGMWKDRWPASKSSVDIVNEWREEMWKGRYDS